MLECEKYSITEENIHSDHLGSGIPLCLTQSQKDIGDNVDVQDDERCGIANRTLSARVKSGEEYKLFDSKPEETFPRASQTASKPICG